MKLSFVVLTHRRTEALLRRCLASLDPARRPEDTEVLVGYNDDAPGCEQARLALEREFTWVRWFALPKLDRGEARNQVVAQARGTFVHFLDDDAQTPEGFAARLLSLYERWPDAPGAGGPNIGPPDAPAFERALEFLLSSPLGAGPMRCRYRRDGPEAPRASWRFMLTNVGLRRSVFVETRLAFPQGCASAEENMLLARVERALGPLVFDPELYVFHRRRTTLRAFAAQVYGNARGRGEITRLDARTLQAAVLAPCLFFAALLALGFLAPRAAAVLAGLYALAVAYATAYLAFRDPAAARHLPAALLAGHAAYAAGLLRGLAARPIHDQARVSAHLRDVAAR